MLGEELKAAEDECTSYKQYLDELEVSSTPFDSEEDYELTLKQVGTHSIPGRNSLYTYMNMLTSSIILIQNPS